MRIQDHNRVYTLARALVHVLGKYIAKINRGATDLYAGAVDRGPSQILDTFLRNKLIVTLRSTKTEPSYRRTGDPFSF